MCPTSWELLESVAEECYRLVVVLLMQSDDMDRIRIHRDSVKKFESVYESISEQVEIVEKDLPRLSTEDLAEIIRSNAQKYRSSYTAEMKGMTSIIIPKKDSIKTEAMGKEWVAILTKKWQLEYLMRNIEEEILNVIVTKCNGNPLMCMQYFINMVHNGFAKV